MHFSSAATEVKPKLLLGARLPRWLLGDAWPLDERGSPQLARIAMADGQVTSVTPMTAADTARRDDTTTWHLDGALVLPGFVDAHLHLDKTFTLPRIGDVQPGLLGAIDASLRDLPNWTDEDIRTRASRGLRWAYEAGSVHVRTHINWADTATLPMAWPVLDALSREWAGRLKLELVSLTRLDAFASMEPARVVAARVAETGPHALMGGFVHSVNWNAAYLKNLLLAAQEKDLDVDLHVDEELNAAAEGLLGTARVLREIGFEGRVVCGHVCALAAQPESVALATLDEVARAPITLVSLPITNLLLQDAATGRTPRMRGITLVKEARARGIPLLFSSDNVQDPFCPVGSYDPIECFASAALAAQLDAPFDNWSDTICRSDLITRDVAGKPALQGEVADLVIFRRADVTSWPSRSGARTVIRGGTVLPD
ncbi:amidohydrolase family protein [Variovorax sp. VNK109]|uniref:amidohydrolase family protein n=1 Tax=Variovorax sp. VNK109 TaxID=3400919 RepID=UPI003C0E2170